jgi:hypothetical protein
VLDRSCAAARLLRKLDRLQTYCARLEQGAGGGPWEALTQALLVASYVHQLTVVDNERSILTGESVNRANRIRRDKHNAARQADAALRDSQCIAEARGIWRGSPRLSVEACADRIIARKKLAVSRKTVANAIRPYHPKKVGNAS